MTKSNATAGSNDFDFAISMAELENITAYLESADVDLDEAIKKFERGSKLAKELKDYLANAENTIEQLKQDFTK